MKTRNKVVVKRFGQTLRAVTGVLRPILFSFLFAYATQICQPSATGCEFTVAGILTRRVPGNEGSVATNSLESFRASVSGEAVVVRTRPQEPGSILDWQFLSNESNSFSVVDYAPPSGKMIRVYMGPNRYKDVPDTSVQTKLLDTTVTASPWVVPRFDGSGVPAIWLAFCSAKYFGKRPQRRAEPLEMSDFGIRESNAQVPAIWSLAADNRCAFVESVVYFTDGMDYTSLNHQITKTRARPPYDKPYTNSFYSVTQWTNFSGMRLPEKFRLVRYAPAEGGTSTNDLKIVETWEGVVTNVSPAASTADMALDLPDKAEVVERRFSRESPPVHQVAYRTTNHMLADLASLRTSPAYVSVRRQSLAEIPRPARRIKVLWVLGALVALPSLVVLLNWVKRRNRAG